MTVPRVDFYVIGSDEPRSRLEFACRLAEKAWLNGHRVFVCVASDDEARALDELLWTFHDRSFVPHELAVSGRPATAPVVIGTEPPEATPDAMLLNLGSEVPERFAGFGRIAEIIDGDAGRRRQGRERFRYYRERGIAPATHNLDDRHEVERGRDPGDA
jgi:DNA polymerase-3 subunit chi